MGQKIYNFIFPVGGGTFGAITQVGQHSDIVFHAFIAAMVGAIVGYCIKKLLDWAWPKLIKLFKKK